jgi:ASC-1-like (ASCH) protein
MTLHLHLKAVYFDAIKAGTKAFEYREFSKWEHLTEIKWSEIVLYRGYPAKGETDKMLRRKWKGFQIIEGFQHEHFGNSPVKVIAIDVSV